VARLTGAQDSYTDGGTHNGGALLPAVIVGDETRAGGRITNGPVWVEHVANRSGALLKDYAARATAGVRHRPILPVYTR
jgi:hypothetical protein